MPAISPAEVENFSRNGFRDEILDTVNGLLKAGSGGTVEVSEPELKELIGARGEGSFEEEMVAVAQLYRAVGWKVIYGRDDSQSPPANCWRFNARCF